jgi:type IX secretion system PorP/SprF family membrane protein
MKLKILLFSFLILIGKYTAQDFHLSQYDAAALNTNPALTGLFEAKYRLHGHYRTQWSAIAQKPFVTGVFGFDMKLKNKWSFGAQILNYHAGYGAYNAFSFTPSVGYNLPLNKLQTHRLSLGLGATVFHKTFNFDQLTWGAQYQATADGGRFNQAINSGEVINQQSVVNVDANFGFMYFYARKGARYNPFLGATLFHLNQPKESFLGSSNKLQLRTLLHAGMRIGVTERISIIPKVFMQVQEKASELTFSAMGQFYMPKKDLFLLAGATFRDGDASIIDFGAKKGAWSARISYDFNYSILKSASSGRGATELSLTYLIFQTKANPQPTCPRL